MAVPIILASASPRRAKLLTEAKIPFETRPADVDERLPKKTAPAQAAIEVAKRKALAVKAQGSWVLAADTLVTHGGKLLGKPEDEMEAHAMLAYLSGEAHEVFTGVVVVSPTGELRTGSERTVVTFRKLTDEEIDAYIRTGDCMDKAGAYGIQGRARAFVSKVEGPIDNVIGLPMDLVRKLLAEAGYQPHKP